jgi:hypothetical protein
MPSEVVVYWPSRVEVAITVGAAAAIPLLMMLFFRVFPIISVYEIEESPRGSQKHEEMAGQASVAGHSKLVAAVAVALVMMIGRHAAALAQTPVGSCGAVLRVLVGAARADSRA